MNSNVHLNPVSPPSENDSEEIDIRQILLVIWSHRKWIALCTVLFAVGGAVYSLFVTPQYLSYASLALKDPGKGAGAGSLFSQFGNVGGSVASQLGVGNTSVAKMEIILKSEALAEAVIRENDLMPLLFPKQWDAETRRWKDPEKAPTLRKGAAALRRGILSVKTDEKRGFVEVAARFRDPRIARKIVDAYLVGINRRIRLNVTTEADSNRRYLESQLAHTADPVLIEKIQSLIALEIEKTMLISSSAFEVMEAPREPLERISPKRKIITGISLVLGLFFGLVSIFVWKGFVASREFLRDSGADAPPRAR